MPRQIYICIYSYLNIYRLVYRKKYHIKKVSPEYGKYDDNMNMMDVW